MSDTLGRTRELEEYLPDWAKDLLTGWICVMFRRSEKKRTTGRRKVREEADWRVELEEIGGEQWVKVCMRVELWRYSSVEDIINEFLERLKEDYIKSTTVKFRRYGWSTRKVRMRAESYIESIRPYVDAEVRSALTDWLVELKDMIITRLTEVDEKIRRLKTREH